MDETQILQSPIESALLGLFIVASNDFQINLDTDIIARGIPAQVAEKIQADIERVFQVSLPENCLFSCPTPRLMARAVIAAGAMKKDALPPVTRVPRDQLLPLTFSQERMWLVYQMDKESTAYNVGGAVGLRGALDHEALQKSLNAVICRHEMMRTVFPQVDGHPVQKILPFQPVPLECIDLSDFPALERQTKALKLANELIRLSFKLEENPPFILRLIKLEKEDHLFVINMHHIMIDAWAISAFFNEMFSFYRTYQQGKEIEIVDPPLQYADYAVWQRQVFSGKYLENQLAYWREKLRGLTPLEIPTSFPRPAVQTHTGSVVNVPIPTELFDALGQLGKGEETTLFMACLAVFYILLYRYTGQTDLPIAVPVANRNFTAAESMIGTLVNTLIMRGELSGEMSFRELLRRVRQVSLEAYDHQDMPYARLVADLQPERDPSRPALAQIMFNMVNVPSEPHLDGFDTYDVNTDRLGVQFDLALNIYEIPPFPKLSLEYDTDLFDRGMMERLLTHYLKLIQSAVAAPDQPLSGLTMLSPEEWQQFEAWNDTSAPYPAEQTILHLFAEQVKRTPHDTAFQQGDASLSYAVLNERANRLARYILRAGVMPGTMVGLCVKRSLDAVTAILAILKAGAAYVPLDPAYPLQRLVYMLQDSGAKVVVGQSASLDPLAEYCEHAIFLDRETKEIGAESADDLPITLLPESPLYILYTSGSTGQPKGVVGTHRAALNRFSWMWQVMPFEPGEVTGQKTALSFVDSVWEIFGPLVKGVATAVIPDEMVKDPSVLVEELSRRGVTRIVMVPSLLRAILDTQVNLGQKLNRLKVWTCASEPLPVGLVRRFNQALPGARLFNLYGSSEDACDVTWYDTRDLPESAVSVPIGRPIFNTTAYIIDDHLNQQPIGIPGEIAIGGANLAIGYHNRPDLTAERFISDPFHPETGGRLYRTGDLGSFMPDGNIVFFGRRDHQVKLRGMRIELEEIEVVLSQHPAVQECKIILVDQAGSNQFLAAYMVPKDGVSAAVEDLRVHLRQKLPDYMVPDRFISLPRLPLNPNGKLDRAALPLADAATRVPEKRTASPRDQLEQLLAAIWEEVLEYQPVGIEDNFFDLGGHSLLAVRLLARIEKVLGVRIPVMLFFQEPTVAGIVQAIRKGADEITWQTIVPIHSQGSLPPFFCVHGFAGGVPGYASLARCLGPDQPFYGLQAHGLDGKTPPAESIEEMASLYIRSIQAEIQPHGPYFLGGYCFGGLVAYEMARQLTAQGEEVALVALFETYPEGRFTHLWRYLAPHYFIAFMRNLPFWWKEEKARRQRARERMDVWVGEYGGALQSLAGVDLEAELIEPSAFIYPGFSQVMAAHQRAQNLYRLGPYSGHVDVFRVRTQRLSSPPDRDFGWRRYAAGGVGVHMIPGSHDNFLDPPYVEGLADTLRAELSRIRSTSEG